MRWLQRHLVLSGSRSRGKWKHTSAVHTAAPHPARIKPVAAQRRCAATPKPSSQGGGWGNPVSPCPNRGWERLAPPQAGGVGKPGFPVCSHQRGWLLSGANLLQYSRKDVRFLSSGCDQTLRQGQAGLSTGCDAGRSKAQGPPVLLTLGRYEEGRRADPLAGCDGGGADRCR